MVSGLSERRTQVQSPSVSVPLYSPASRHEQSVGKNGAHWEHAASLESSVCRPDGLVAGVINLLQL